ncbi:MAG: hypothetical protein AB9856_06500 [Cellulosilyticaceae bacterium]
MGENFDCTQFLTFDSILAENEVIKKLLSYENIGFKVIVEKDIRNIKKGYFKNYRKQIFIELEYDDFIGEMDEWKDINDVPPKLISDFIKITKDIIRQEEITNLTIILASFADMGVTTNEVLNASVDKLEYSLFHISMSSPYNPVDNLIIEVENKSKLDE